MTVLITGAGLIGGLAAEALAARGEAVLLTDIREPSRLPAGCRFARCDMRDRETFDRLVAEHGVTRIVHTAAVLSTGMRTDPGMGLEVNLMGIVNLLEICRRHGIARLVNASSATVVYSGFGRLGPKPMDEDVALRLVTERPSSLYAIGKLTSEQLCLHYRDAYGVPTVSLRFAAVIGGDPAAPTSVPGRLLATLVAGARTGRAVLDDPLLAWAGTEEFVDARDCAGASLAALDAPAPDHGVYAVAWPEPVTLAEFAEAVRRVHGSFDLEIPEPPRAGFAGFPHLRPAASCLDRARAELGFSCRHDIEDAVRHWG